jgi:hypothetical protein
VAVGLAVAEADRHLAGHAGDLQDDRVVRLQRRREGLRVGVTQVGEVSAECGVGEDEQRGTLAASVVDELADPGDVEVEVPPEVGGRGRDPDQAHAIAGYV